MLCWPSSKVWLFKSGFYLLKRWRTIAIAHAYGGLGGVSVVISISILNLYWFSEPNLKQHYFFMELILAGVVGLEIVLKGD